MHTIERLAERYSLHWCSLFACIVIIQVVAALYTLSVSVWWGPWRDMWEALPFMESALAGQATWFDYWDQYGYSHRPLISRWLWVADLRWFAGSNHLLLAVSFLMQGVIFLSVLAVLRRDEQRTPVESCWLLAGVLFCLLNIAQVFNFLHTFDVQWFLTAGFVVWAFERLLAGAPQQRGGCVLAAWVLILLASLNNFSALVAWPVAGLLLYLLQYSRQQLLGFGIAAIAYLALYFHGLPTGSHALMQDVLQQDAFAVAKAVAGILVVFPLWYLSNPLSFQLAGDGPLQMPWPVTWLAPGIVGVLLCMAAWHGVQLACHRRTVRPLALLGLALMAYGYGVGIVTALGRGMFWDNVYALRYQNIVLLFWVGVMLWLATGGRWRYSGLAAGTILLLSVYAVRADWYHDLMLKTGNRTRDAHLALRVGLEGQLPAIQATVSRSHLYPDSDYQLVSEAAFLRRLPAGPYADPDWQVPAQETLVASPDCGQAVARFDVHGGEEGYARLSIDFAAPVTYGLIAWFDENPQAPGLLVAERSDDWWDRVQQTRHGFTSYAGFARALPRQKPVAVFARAGQQWCRLQLLAGQAAD